MLEMTQHKGQLNKNHSKWVTGKHTSWTIFFVNQVLSIITAWVSSKECTSSMTGQSLTIAQHKDWHMGTIVYHNQGRFQSMLDVAAQFLLIMTAPKQEHD